MLKLLLLITLSLPLFTADEYIVVPGKNIGNITITKIEYNKKDEPTVFFISDGVKVAILNQFNPKNKRQLGGKYKILHVRIVNNNDIVDGFFFTDDMKYVEENKAKIFKNIKELILGPLMVAEAYGTRTLYN